MVDESFLFFFHLYNLPAVLHDVPVNIKRDLEALKLQVSYKQLAGFTAANRPAKRRKTDSNPPTGSYNTSYSDNPPLTQMLLNSKYHLLLDVEDRSPRDVRCL